MRRAGILVLGLAGAALLAAPASAGGPQKKTVKIADNYYLPATLTVNRDSTVTWKWPSVAGDVHDVKLKSAPAGVKKFHSQPASSDYVFRRKLSKPGLYKLVCTLHEEMRMTIRVRR